MNWNKKSDVLALMVGHGTQLNGVWDSGCVYGKYTEADLMLPIVKVAVKCLRRSGIRVITDADKGNNRNMKSSVAWANKVGAKLYMSIHCDYKFQKAGVAPLFKTSSGEAMAMTVGKKVAKYMGMKYRCSFKRTDLFELNATNMPAVIFETGAIRLDLKYLKSYKKYGRSLAKAICSYIGVKYVSATLSDRFNTKFIQVLKYMNKHHFKYKASYKDCATTWKGAKKKKTSNCSMAVSYTLQIMGVFKEGWFFWINDENINCRGGLTKAKLTKIFIITHPHKKPKSANLKKGNIVGYGGKYNAHTMAFSKNTKKGTPMWCSWSAKDIGKKVPHVKKTYTNRPISTVMRFR